MCWTVFTFTRTIFLVEDEMGAACGTRGRTCRSVPNAHTKPNVKRRLVARSLHQWECRRKGSIKMVVEQDVGVFGCESTLDVSVLGTCGWLFCVYRGADKSLARPGRKQARNHFMDARDFNNIETRAVINFFFFSKARRRRKFTPF